jgi:hypothetical protein
MKTPKMLRKINEASNETKVKIESMIEKSLENEYIISYPIEDFSLMDLDILAEYGKENQILVFLKAEHSNIHQGTLVSLIRKDIAAEFIKHL